MMNELLVYLDQLTVEFSSQVYYLQSWMKSVASFIIYSFFPWKVGRPTGISEVGDGTRKADPTWNREQQWTPSHAEYQRWICLAQNPPASPRGREAQQGMFGSKTAASSKRPLEESYYSVDFSFTYINEKWPHFFEKQTNIIHMVQHLDYSFHNNIKRVINYSAVFFPSTSLQAKTFHISIMR